MKEFEIRITNKADNSDFCTIDTTAESLEDLRDIIEPAINYSDALAFENHIGQYITIDEHADGGYSYNVYDNKKVFFADADPIDGGICTGTLSDAIGMALDV